MRDELMSEKSLAEEGWKSYPPSPGLDRFDAVYQRRVTDDKGIRLFVNVRLWRHSRYSTPERAVPDGWDAWAQLRCGPRTFNLNLLNCDAMTPDEVENFFDSAWQDMGCDHYGLWD